MRRALRRQGNRLCRREDLDRASGVGGARLIDGGLRHGGKFYAIDDPSALLTARQTLHDPMYINYRPDAIVWMVDLGGVQVDADDAVGR